MGSASGREYLGSAVVRAIAEREPQTVWRGHTSDAPVTLSPRSIAYLFLPIALLLVLLLAPRVVARAQPVPATPAHPRSVQVTFLMQPGAPAVLVSETAVWAPNLPGQPLSVCAPGHRCVPIASSETCTPPRCPGAGTLLLTATPVRDDVADFPESLDDWKEEVAAMRLDPALAPVLGNVGAHPDDHAEEPVAWATDEDEDELGYELRVGLLAGGLATQGGGYLGAEFVAAMRLHFHVDSDDGYDSGEQSIIDTALGDSGALEMRIALQGLSDAQGDDRVSTSIGFAFSGANVMDGGRFRIASVLSALLPELGMFFRRDYDTAFYARMSFPIAWAVSSSLALELRPSVTIIDAWVEGPTNEVLLGVSLGAIVH